MPRLADLSPELLRTRHRLSPEQINAVTGRDTVQESAEEKAGALMKAGEFIRVADLMSEARIPFITLKGPELSYRLYGDMTSRHYRDFDILVAPGDMEKASEILEHCGYRAEAPGWPAGRKQRRILTAHTNEISFYNQSCNLTIELHWRLLKNPVVSFSRLEEIVNQNHVILEFAGRNYRVLSDELELLYLVIHGSNHWWRRLKWLVDVSEFMRSIRIDAPLFTRLSAELKAERMVELCNAILSEYIPGAPLLPCSKKASPYMVRFSQKRIRSERDLAEDFYGRIAGSVFFALISFPGTGYKLRTIRNYLFVPSFFGSSRLLSSLPLFYLYGSLMMASRRLKRWS